MSLFCPASCTSLMHFLASLTTSPHKEHLVTRSRTNLSACGMGKSSCSKGCSASQSSHEHTGHPPWRWETSSRGAGKTGLLCWGGQTRMHRSPCHGNFTTTGHSASSTGRASGNKMSQHRPSDHQTHKGKSTPRANNEIC